MHGIGSFGKVGTVLFYGAVIITAPIWAPVRGIKWLIRKIKGTE